MHNCLLTVKYDFGGENDYIIACFKKVAVLCSVTVTISICVSTKLNANNHINKRGPRIIWTLVPSSWT